MSLVSPLKNGFPNFGDMELDKKSGLPFKLGSFHVVDFRGFEPFGHLPEHGHCK